MATRIWLADGSAKLERHAIRHAWAQRDFRERASLWLDFQPASRGLGMGRLRGGAGGRWSG
jgi:hypothetical protein